MLNAGLIVRTVHKRCTWHSVCAQMHMVQPHTPKTPLLLARSKQYSTTTHTITTPCGCHSTDHLHGYKSLAQGTPINTTQIKTRRRLHTSYPRCSAETHTHKHDTTHTSASTSTTASLQFRARSNQRFSLRHTQYPLKGSVDAYLDSIIHSPSATRVSVARRALERLSPTAEHGGASVGVTKEGSGMGDIRGINYSSLIDQPLHSTVITRAQEYVQDFARQVVKGKRAKNESVKNWASDAEKYGLRMRVEETRTTHTHSDTPTDKPTDTHTNIHAIATHTQYEVDGAALQEDVGNGRVLAQGESLRAESIEEGQVYGQTKSDRPGGVETDTTTSLHTDTSNATVGSAPGELAGTPEKLLHTPWETTLANRGAMTTQNQTVGGDRPKEDKYMLKNLATEVHRMRKAKNSGYLRDAESKVDALMSRQALVSADATHAIAIYKDVHQPQKAVQVLRLLQTRQHPVFAYHYAPVVAALGAAGDIDGAFEMFIDMDKHNIRKNTVVYASLMHVYVRAGLGQVAIHLMREMRLEGITPDELVYNTAIGAYGQNQQWDRAHGLLEEMRANDIVPSVATYNAFLTAYANTDRLSSVQQLMEEMRQRGVNPDTMTYSIAIDVCAKIGEYNIAMNLYNDMSKDKVTRSKAIYKSLMTLCATYGEADMAIGLLSKMSEEKVKVSYSTYVAAIRSCEKNRQHDTALKVFQMMFSNDGKRPGPAAYNAVMNVHNASAMFQTSVNILRGKSLTKVGDAETYNLGITACSMVGNMDKAVRLMHDMRAKGFTPTAHTGLAIVNACCKAKRCKDAVAMLELVEATDEQPQDTLYNSVIGVCTWKGEWNVAVSIADRMRQKGIRWNAGTYRNVVASLVEIGGAIDRIDELYEQMTGDLDAVRNVWAGFHRTGTLDLSLHSPYTAQAAIRRLSQNLAKQQKENPSKTQRNIVCPKIVAGTQAMFSAVHAEMSNMSPPLTAVTYVNGLVVIDAKEFEKWMQR
ncbi:hypothetical protein SARC_07831 [Sphaeroforma arctica JP610]|uniref:PROP1-like PPR domain-containing protein n=1 Tax=Sphaeroforma arctica JP610 TaxID=667725 RepID=A0A0L0FSN2_9EUKA|nr:hypothetical protein SARC_07831 [Sphaeroforma arctica JP610]KNC79790.1 hypothetical protein SARC_07831 [Sphaeroforma arctica JP610]|eukprot:XP_014153692.1 hypothetical protein SARC_07831 [Sphaeroforma arctica JP610]